MIPDEHFERFDTKKYRSKSRVKRWLIRRFARSLFDLVIEAGPLERVLEIGVGEGFLSGFLSERLPTVDFWGIDLSEADIGRLRQKFPRIHGQVGSIYDVASLGQRFDVVVCAEILEHLDDPGRALDAVHALAPRRAIFSVPHEPWFMLSNLAAGKNVTRLGNDPEHINHFGNKSFAKLLESRFRVDRQVTSYPWILALTTPR